MADISVVPEQLRAARGLLDWSQEQLAEVAGVGLSTVRDFEATRREPIQGSVLAMRQALEGAGVVFIPSNGDGPGVRLAGPRPLILPQPPRANIARYLPFLVDWRGQRVIVFMPCDTLDDLDRVSGHSSDAAFIASFERHQELILDRTATAITAGRIADNGHLYLDPSDFPEA